MASKFYNVCNDNHNKLKDIITKKIDITKTYEYAFNENIVEMYLDGKLKFKAEYNIMGMYNIPLSVWYWSWNIAFINKDLIKVMDPVKDFIKILDKDYAKFDRVEAEELQYMLSNGNFYISGKNIDKLFKMVLYLTKSIWYFPIRHNDKEKDVEDKLEYILITKILQFS
jgi:hypothetical protein